MKKIKRRELEQRVAQAQSADEVRAILAEDGTEVSAEEAEVILQRAKEALSPNGKELSSDELEAVSGGVTERDWIKDGCAATVEDGSKCWGTAGNCWRSTSTTRISQKDTVQGAVNTDSYSSARKHVKMTVFSSNQPSASTAAITARTHANRPTKRDVII